MGQAIVSPDSSTVTEAKVAGSRSGSKTGPERPSHRLAPNPIARGSVPSLLIVVGSGRHPWLEQQARDCWFRRKAEARRRSSDIARRRAKRKPEEARYWRANAHLDRLGTHPSFGGVVLAPAREALRAVRHSIGSYSLHLDGRVNRGVGRCRGAPRSRAPARPCGRTRPPARAARAAWPRRDGGRRSCPR